MVFAVFYSAWSIHLFRIESQKFDTCISLLLLFIPVGSCLVLSDTRFPNPCRVCSFLLFLISLSSSQTYYLIISFTLFEDTVILLFLYLIFLHTKVSKIPLSPLSSVLENLYSQSSSTCRNSIDFYLFLHCLFDKVTPNFLEHILAT
jgi:hypothetical protein